MKKNRKYNSLILLVSVLTSKLYSQQDPMYSMYTFDKMLINPAFCGSSNWAVTTIKDREQFIGLNGRPSTKTINFHAPIQAKHLGIGVKIIQDKIAFMRNLNAMAALSYHLNFAGGKLSLGLEGGLYSKKIDFSEILVTHIGDKALAASGNQAASVPDLNTGIYYQKKQLYFGFSAYHLLKSNFKFDTQTTKSHLSKHFYFIAGNVFDINKNFSYEPSILLKIQASSATQIDLNNFVYYQDKFGLGINYRTSDAIGIMAKYNISESLRIAYGYDITISKFKTNSKGAHEILISYGIKLPPPPVNKETHPRYYF